MPRGCPTPASMGDVRAPSRAGGPMSRSEHSKHISFTTEPFPVETAPSIKYCVRSAGTICCDHIASLAVSPTLDGTTSFVLGLLASLRVTSQDKRPDTFLKPECQSDGFQYVVFKWYCMTCTIITGLPYGTDAKSVCACICFNKMSKDSNLPQTGVLNIELCSLEIELT